MCRSADEFKIRFLQASDYGIGYDCKFIVGPEKNVVEGHKFLFSVASEVFQAMFYGDLKEENTVKIEDLDSEGFKAMKHFIYTGEVNFTSAIHALSTYIAARKYLISQLMRECISYSQKQLSPSQVLQFYETCVTHNISEFDELCLKIIEEKTDQIIVSDYFPTAQAETIQLILKSRSISLESEIEVFYLFEKWALAEAARQQLSDGELASSFKHLKKYVRFLTISSQEFTARIQQSLLLTPTEKLAIDSNLSQLNPKPMPLDLSMIRQQRNFLTKSITLEKFDYSRTLVLPLSNYCDTCIGSSCRFDFNYNNYCLSISITKHHNHICFFIQPLGDWRGSWNSIFIMRTKVSVLAVADECDDLVFRDHCKVFYKKDIKQHDRQTKVLFAEIPINEISDKFYLYKISDFNVLGPKDIVKVLVQCHVEKRI